MSITITDVRMWKARGNEKLLAAANKIAYEDAGLDAFADDPDVDAIDEIFFAKMPHHDNPYCRVECGAADGECPCDDDPRQRAFVVINDSWSWGEDKR